MLAHAYEEVVLGSRPADLSVICTIECRCYRVIKGQYGISNKIFVIYQIHWDTNLSSLKCHWICQICIQNQIIRQDLFHTFHVWLEQILFTVTSKNSCTFFCDFLQEEVGTVLGLKISSSLRGSSRRKYRKKVQDFCRSLHCNIKHTDIPVA